MDITGVCKGGVCHTLDQKVTAYNQLWMVMDTIDEVKEPLLPPSPVVTAE